MKMMKPSFPVDGHSLGFKLGLVVFLFFGLWNWIYGYPLADVYEQMQNRKQFHWFFTNDRFGMNSCKTMNIALILLCDQQCTALVYSVLLRS